MSSIAYAADEKMLAYHRLCGNRNVNFWRLSDKAAFKNFRPGDLLFFYARMQGMRRKGLVGYAHFASASLLSLTQMWKAYGTRNGYDNMEQLQQAIEKASRDHRLPSKMMCLYLKEVIFFQSAVYPKDVGITIHEKLESYTYLDQEDADVTLRILAKAEKIGVDRWVMATEKRDEEIFRKDAVQYQMANLAQKMPPLLLSASEKKRAERLMKRTFEKQACWKAVESDGFEWYLLDTEKNCLTIAVPLLYSRRNYAQQLQSTLGRLLLFKLSLEKETSFASTVHFQIVEEKPLSDTAALMQKFNTL